MAPLLPRLEVLLGMSWGVEACHTPWTAVRLT